jgi:hypothetical protein
MDGLYWSLGVIGILVFFQIWSMRMLIERLPEDSKWVVMALLLKSYFDGVR